MGFVGQVPGRGDARPCEARLRTGVGETTQRIVGRIDAAGRKRWQGRRSSCELGVQDIDGVTNVQPAVIIGVAGVVAGGGLAVRKQEVQRKDRIPNIEEVENNIHAGTKYLRFIHDRYFADASNMTEIDKGLFSFAAYNAGPARVARLRVKAGEMGLDPDVWFRNVEIVAAQDIGRETVQYVSNIFKYYIAYQRMEEMRAARQ